MFDLDCGCVLHSQGQRVVVFCVRLILKSGFILHATCVTRHAQAAKVCHNAGYPFAGAQVSAGKCSLRVEPRMCTERSLTVPSATPLEGGEGGLGRRSKGGGVFAPPTSDLSEQLPAAALCSC